MWATIYSIRVWHHNHGEGWPDAETDLRHGWSAWDHMGRRCGTCMYIEIEQHCDLLNGNQSNRLRCLLTMASCDAALEQPGGVNHCNDAIWLLPTGGARRAARSRQS